jgi:hypothetical protein
MSHAVYDKRYHLVCLETSVNFLHGNAFEYAIGGIKERKQEPNTHALSYFT